MGKELAELRYNNWKNVTPILYDWITHHNLMWPSLSCRWGQQLEQHTFKNMQRIYLSEQTDGSMPNTLVVATAQVVKPRTAAADHIAQVQYTEVRSPYVVKHKTIVHPGEVNRIRELSQNSNIVATHSDVPEVYIWNVDTQPNLKASAGTPVAIADLVLEGHTADAPYALATSPAGPYVLSGGTDNKVVLWSIEDHMTSLGAVASGSSSKSANGKGKLGTSVQARSIFSGHTATVEDVCFHPTSVQELCSVGDDHALLIWDARASTSAPVLQVQNAHEDDVQCVDWNTHDTNLILTGSADKTVKLFDRRKLAQGRRAVHTFESHTGAVLCVQWHPQSPTVFGSSAEDGMLNVWNTDMVGKKRPVCETMSLEGDGPSELFFQHAGHRARLVDFHWNPVDPWVVMSASDDVDLKKGGGTIHIWRMNDLLYKDEEVVKAELSEFLAHMTKPSEAKRKTPIPEKEAPLEAAKKVKAENKAVSKDAKRDEAEKKPTEKKPAEEKTERVVDVEMKAADEPVEREAGEEKKTAEDVEMREEAPAAAPQPEEEPTAAASAQEPATEKGEEIPVPSEEVIKDKPEAVELAGPGGENGAKEEASSAAPMEGVEEAKAPAEESKVEETAEGSVAEGSAEAEVAPAEVQVADEVAAAGDPAQQGATVPVAAKEPVAEDNVVAEIPESDMGVDGRAVNEG